MAKFKGLFALTLISMSHGLFADTENKIRLIVKYKQNHKNTHSLKAATEKIVNLPVHSLIPMAGDAYILSIDRTALSRTNGSEEDATDIILKRLRQNPEIAYAVTDRKGYFKPMPPISKKKRSSPALSHDVQWDEFARPQGIMLESAPGQRDGAWAFTTGYKIPPVIVAVLDTGIETHQSLNANLLYDLQGNIWGWNFAANNNDLHDETRSYHGTHVAGTIAAKGNVMSGVGEHIKILPVKIPDSSGMFYESAVINAIYWAVGAPVPNAPKNPFPAKVLNMSFGVDEQPGKEIDHCDEALQEALKYVRQQGAVVVAAAGNDNRWEHYNAPAVCNGTIKVASTGPSGLRAYYSNYGPSITFAAPGGDLRYGKIGGILSTVKPGSGYQQSGFDFFQGTSMASPHVAGVAGLVIAASQTTLSPQQIEQILYATTHGFGQSSKNDDSCTHLKPFGHGILDAENAVKAVLAQFDVIFSAPAVKKENGKNTATIDKHWIPHAKVDSEPQGGLSFVFQKEDGKIYAQSGGMQYRLNDSIYQDCEIIGFDGVGCYQ